MKSKVDCHLSAFMFKWTQVYKIVPRVFYIISSFLNSINTHTRQAGCVVTCCLPEMRRISSPDRRRKIKLGRGVAVSCVVVVVVLK